MVDENSLLEVIRLIDEKEEVDRKYNKYIEQQQEEILKKANELNLEKELIKLPYLEAKKKLEKLFFVIDYEEFKRLNDALRLKQIERENKSQKIYYKSIVDKIPFLSQKNKDKLANFLVNEKQFRGYDILKLLDDNNFGESDKKEDVLQYLLKFDIIEKTYKFRCKNKHHNCSSRQLNQKQFKELIDYNSYKLKEVDYRENLNLKHNLYCGHCDSVTRIENLGMLYNLIKFEHFIVKTK